MSCECQYQAPEGRVTFVYLLTIRDADSGEEISYPFPTPGRAMYAASHHGVRNINWPSSSLQISWGFATSPSRSHGGMPYCFEQWEAVHNNLYLTIRGFQF